MNKLKILGFLILVTILISGCTSTNNKNFTKLHYTSDLSGTIYVGEDCVNANCTKWYDSLGGGREQWSEPYTPEAWNETRELNLTEMIYEVMPSGIVKVNVLMDDRYEVFQGDPNERYMQYRAEIIYPTQKITVFMKFWVKRK